MLQDNVSAPKTWRVTTATDASLTHLISTCNAVATIATATLSALSATSCSAKQTMETASKRN